MLAKPPGTGHFGQILWTEHAARTGAPLTWKLPDWVRVALGGYAP